MVQFTKFLQQMPENFFGSLARKTFPPGKEVFDFSKGNPDLAPLSSIRLQASNYLEKEEGHGYGPGRGQVELRQQLARFYRQYFQIEINPDEEILITAGAKEALWLLALALIGPHSTVAINDVSYPLYGKMTELLGGKIEYFSLAVDGKSHLRLHQIPKNIQVAFLTDPHMPLGRKVEPASLSKFCETLTAQSGALILDSPYGMLFSGRLQSIFHFDPEKKCGFEVGSCSKIFQMAGWRVGWIVAGKEHIQLLLKLKGYLDNGIFTPLQMGAATALAIANTDRQYFPSLQAVYQERREQMQQLMALLGLHWEDGQEGMFCWGKMVPHHPYGHDDQRFVQEILSQTNVIFTPGSLYGPGGVGHLRASLTVPSTKICAAREIIQACKLIPGAE